LLFGLRRIRTQSEKRRIGLIFTLIVTLLVFAHDQPWPYVFVMSIPFLALWALDPIDALGQHSRHRRYAYLLLGVALALSVPRNASYLAMDNHDQLEMIARADAMLRPGDVYFDGIGTLPNHPEPSTLWLDRHFIIATVAEGERSEAYRIFSRTPPKLILWSYRMDDIDRVVAPLLRDRYVKVAPNILVAGHRLEPGKVARFDVPVAGRYALYRDDGRPLIGRLALAGKSVAAPVELTRGPQSVTLVEGAAPALLLPEGDYAGRVEPATPHRSLYDSVYD